MDMDSERPMGRHFSPYAMNGGSVVAIAGTDFSIIASDTRLSEGFSIHSRNSSKIFKLTGNTVLGCAGFHGDILTLTKMVDARLKLYKDEHNKQMSTGAVAAMLATMLYHRRFFPYYVHNIVAGIDEEGKGAIYSFDPVGSYERETFRAAGTGSEILQPLMDNQIGHKNMPKGDYPPLSRDEAIAMIKDIFVSAAERDIYTGDCVDIKLITREGCVEEKFPLRRD